MTAEPVDEQAGDDDLPSLGALQPGYYLGRDSGCPPEYADVPIQEILAQIAAARQDRATEPESLAAGFLPRPSTRPSDAPIPSHAGSGFESGGVLDVCPPDGPLAGLTDAVTRDGRLAELSDDELIGGASTCHARPPAVRGCRPRAAVEVAAWAMAMRARSAPSCACWTWPR